MLRPAPEDPGAEATGCRDQPPRIQGRRGWGVETSPRGSRGRGDGVLRPAPEDPEGDGALWSVDPGGAHGPGAP